MVLTSAIIISTVRSSKVDTCKKSFSVYGDKVEIVALDDYAKGVYPEIIKGMFNC